MIPFNSLEFQHQSIREEIIQTMIETYDSNWYILGEKLKKFEKEFSTYSQTNFTVGTGNGLDALKIALKTLGIHPGDEVIIPANTFIASILAITALQAIPVLVEPDYATFNIDPNKIEEKITRNTKVIMPVHLFGLPCQMDTIKTIADKHSLFIVEDNAQAVGASINNKKTGSFGNINATSFYPTKNLGALGDGGAVTTSDEFLFKKAMLLRNYGSAKKYYNEIEGYNSRLDEIQASILSVKLNYLDQWNEERIKLATYYSEKLKELDSVKTPFYDASNYYHTFHLYVLKVHSRTELIEHLSSRSIQTVIHYPIPFYRQNAYSQLGINASDYPITEKLAAESLSLPLYPGLTKENQDYIISSIKEFYSK